MAKPATTLFAIFILLIPAANATPSPSLQPTLKELERFFPIEEAPSPSLGADSVEDLKFMLPFLNGECWSTIKDVPGCAGEVLQSIFTFKLKIGPNCCGVIQNIGDKCLQNLFGVFPFNPASLICPPPEN
ncbi:egg cell-secreted protein 1.1-like [Asparagus officinalis]|uniref:egg cell-secreted protein 1.1-like n=1 Tax=Asparagus officinalis TaxID=4686 RepID=UPI00098E3029|nr:egg cell-secreted protein 1.1-like [Asparagus officinalis]